jgi:hypothetical protein
MGREQEIPCGENRAGGVPGLVHTTGTGACRNSLRVSGWVFAGKGSFDCICVTLRVRQISLRMTV